MVTPVSVRVFAPAKVNLTLHVTGRRDDGYHLLDSLVAFADVGDEVVIHSGKTNSVATEGPEAASVPAGMDNLVLRIAALFDDMPSASFLLTKNLPVASGIGGGSADAAAAFRGLMTVRSGGEVSPALYDPARTPLLPALLKLGADIPMCLLSRSARVQGIGEDISPLADLPPLYAVLANPRRGVSTPTVFRTLANRENPAMPRQLPRFAGPDDFMTWLATQRNDLQQAAITLEPSIAEVLGALDALPGCRLARMSGSGATCYGLFDTVREAEEAARSLGTTHPTWWVAPAQLGSQSERALPRVS